MSQYNPERVWTKEYLNQKEMMFPSEYVIRIFKGSYPRLNLDKNSFKNKKICDLGCGDGRNLLLLDQVGFDVYGMEITEEIVNKAKSNLAKVNIYPDIQVGVNDDIPFENNFFDYLLSWNSLNYMGKNLDFAAHIKELARILKKDGYLVLSLPIKSCFIFNESEKLKDGYQIIRNDPFKLRNGEVLRVFQDENELENTFSKYFTNFTFGTIHDDCFGIANHWYLTICQKK